MLFEGGCGPRDIKNGVFNEAPRKVNWRETCFQSAAALALSLQASGRRFFEDPERKASAVRVEPQGRG